MRGFTRVSVHSAPLIGPALGPIVGGALTQAFDWRATFWFLSILMGIVIFAFVFFKDTFRRQRSLTYQAVLRRIREQQELARRSETSTLSHATVVDRSEAEKPQHGAPFESEKVQNFRPKEASNLTSNQLGVPSDDSDIEAAQIKEIKLSLKDVNPIPPMLHVLRRLNNLAILTSSGENHLHTRNYSAD